MVHGVALRVSRLTPCNPALLSGLERLFMSDYVWPGFEYCCLLLLFLLFFHLQGTEIIFDSKVRSLIVENKTAPMC